MEVEGKYILSNSEIKARWKRNAELKPPTCTPADTATLSPVPDPSPAPRHTTPLSDTHTLPPHALNPILTRALPPLPPSPPPPTTVTLTPPLLAKLLAATELALAPS